MKCTHNKQRASTAWHLNNSKKYINKENFNGGCKCHIIDSPCKQMLRDSVEVVFHRLHIKIRSIAPLWHKRTMMTTNLWNRRLCRRDEGFRQWVAWGRIWCESCGLRGETRGETVTLVSLAAAREQTLQLSHIGRNQLDGVTLAAF